MGPLSEQELLAEPRRHSTHARLRARRGRACAHAAVGLRAPRGRAQAAAGSPDVGARIVAETFHRAIAGRAGLDPRRARTGRRRLPARAQPFTMAHLLLYAVRAATRRLLAPLERRCRRLKARGQRAATARQGRWEDGAPMPVTAPSPHSSWRPRRAADRPPRPAPRAPPPPGRPHVRPLHLGRRRRRPGDLAPVPRARRRAARAVRARRVARDHRAPAEPPRAAAPCARAAHRHRRPVGRGRRRRAGARAAGHGAPLAACSAPSPACPTGSAG